MPPEQGKQITLPEAEPETRDASEPADEEDTLVSPHRDRFASRLKGSRSSAWWLPLAFFLSIFLHLVVGYGTQKLGLFRLEPYQTPRNDVDVTFVTPPTAKKSGPEAPVPAPAPAETPAPVPTPIESFDNFVRPPLPERLPTVPKLEPTPVPPVAVAPVPQPSVTLPPQPTPPVTVPDVPKTVMRIVPPTLNARTTTATATRNSRVIAPGRLPDRLPEPLPRGDLSADPTISIPGHQVTLKPFRQPVNRAAEPETPGGGANAGGAPRITATPADNPVPKPAPGTGTEAAVPGAGSGGGRGEAAGGATGAGKGLTATLGIDRGIPFGDKLGIYGGNAAGGGGGRPSNASVTRLPGGGVRVSLKRQPSAAGLLTPAVHIVYLLDVSSSMSESGKVRKAREALHKALDELQPDDTFSIITFGTNAAGSAKAMTATRSNLAVGHANINAIDAEPNSATNFSAALEMALSQPEMTHLFVLSDGVPTEGIIDPNELLAFVRQRNTRNIHIITYALLGGGEGKKGFDFLKNLSLQNSGHFEYVDMN